jgi:signal transduction histidine kinase/DNA-binding response OmpR family regulator/CHASE3 domain sensor protein
VNPLRRRPPQVVTLAGFGVAICLLAVAGWVSWRSQQSYQSAVAATEHTYSVLDVANELSAHIRDAEAAGRGYALSGLPGLKTGAQRDLAKMPRLLDSLDALVADNPQQSTALDAIRLTLANRAALIVRLMVLRDSTGGVSASFASVVAQGNTVTILLRRQLNAFAAEERRLLEDRQQSTVHRGLVATFTVASALVLALMILGAATSVTLQELKERQRAEAKLQLEAERQAVVIEMQQAIATAHVGDDDVMELIVEQAMQLTEADGAVLALLEGDRFLTRSARGNLSTWVGKSLPVGHTIVGWVSRHREPTLVEDALDDPRVDPNLARTSGNRSMVVLPVLESDTPVGVMMITSKRPRAFSTQDFAVLKIMSGIISAGFTNASAFEANERLLAALRASRDAAEEANRAKSAFLATMSHELRTPLNSVIGFANLLRRNRAGTFGAQDLQFLDRIRDNGTHLLNLINDILDVSKIEAGRMEVRPVPTDLGPLVRETLAQLEGQQRDRPVALRADVPDGLLPVEVDPHRFRQVLINLIGNALKFTEAGSVTLRVVADPRGLPLALDVIDTGVGIPPERLEAIFEAFTQADATTERRFGGTGLGLTISRQLLRLMGADLTVTSTVGQGSTFRIAFPVSAARAAVEEHRRDHTTLPLAGASSAPLILIVDDEHDARTLMRTYLEEDGYRTAEAVNGAAALEAARTLRPKLITLDLRMPEMSGVEFLRQLRADPEIADIPVLVVSIEAAEQRGSLIGAVDVLAKPVERDNLLRVIQRVLPTGRKRILVVDDDVHTRQLFTAVLGAEGYRIRTARDGLEAFAAIEQELPDLLILDLMMPVMDGGTFLATLRRNPRYAAIPVMVVTALDADSEAVKRLDGAAHAVVQKGPALEQSLQRIISDMLGTRTPE